MPRVILCVLDSFGIGGAPDAAEYGDEGANTLGHIAEKCAAGEADQEGCAKGRFNCPIWICWASALPLKRRAVESPQVFQLTIAAGFGPMPAKSQKARIRRRAIGKSQVCPCRLIGAISLKPSRAFRQI